MAFCKDQTELETSRVTVHGWQPRQSAPEPSWTVRPSRHGQSALDFLMTYGWALLIMTLVIVGLFSLGIFDTGSFVGTRATGFVQISPVGWQLTPDGTLSIMFKNNAGTDIVITHVNATLGAGLPKTNNTLAISIPNGEQAPSNVMLTGFGTQSGSYTIRIAIGYNDSTTGFPYTDTGTLSGKVT